MLFSSLFLRVKPEIEEIKQNLKTPAVPDGSKWPLSQRQCTPLITQMGEVSSGKCVAFVMTVLTAGGEEMVCQRSHDMVTHSPISYWGRDSSPMCQMPKCTAQQWKKPGNVKSMDVKDSTLDRLIRPISLCFSSASLAQDLQLGPIYLILQEHRCWGLSLGMALQGGLK